MSNAALQSKLWFSLLFMSLPLSLANCASPSASCERAAEHLSSCLDQEATAFSDCTAADAEEILARDCEGLRRSWTAGKADFIDVVCSLFGIGCPYEPTLAPCDSLMECEFENEYCNTSVPTATSLGSCMIKPCDLERQEDALDPTQCPDGYCTVGGAFAGDQAWCVRFRSTPIACSPEGKCFEGDTVCVEGLCVVATCDPSVEGPETCGAERFCNVDPDWNAREGWWVDTAGRECQACLPGNQCLEDLQCVVDSAHPDGACAAP